ncbi:MAG TPA: hypothetical protein VHK24_09470, partial [Steroidobacter sp.]|nr:hypothetical protein [Steroidobacter sp.]
MAAIVACCSKAGLAVIRALGERGIPIAGVYFGKNQVGAASRFVTKAYSFPDPSEDEESFIDALLRLERRWDGAALFPTDDASLVAVSRHWRLLEQRYGLVSQPWELVGKLIEKHHTYRIALEHGVPCPSLQMAGSLEESLEFTARIGFPCLLKPSVGHLFFKRYRKKMLMVHSEAELREHMKTVREYGGQLMLCEYIPGGDE